MFRRFTGSIRVVSWADVGDALRRARSLRRQTQAAFAREIGLSVRLIGALEAGEVRQYDDTTRDRVESVLGWAPGSIERVVNGQAPIIEVDLDFARIRDAWPRLSPDVRRLLAAFAITALRLEDEPPE